MDHPAQIDIAGDGTVRVTLAGTVILVRHDDVLPEVERALKAEHGTRVQVDLSEVTALDSSGVALLLLTRRLATRSGAQFGVRGAGPEVLEHLQMAGLTGLFGLRAADGCGSATGAVARPGGSGPAVVMVLDEPFDLHGIKAIRGRLAEYAISCAMSHSDRYKLLLAATEIMANVVRHGGGRGTIAVERRDDRLLLRVRDRGPGIPRRHRRRSPRPRPGRVGSAGLWLARQICERVDIDTGPSGTTVLLTFALPPHVD
jgi:anti-anti-sigma factor